MKRLLSKQKKQVQQAGFTLVELMVALTLFTVVVIAAVSSLYTVNSSARKVESMRSVLDNLNFAIESMSRTIRTGTDIVCGGTLNGTSDHNCTFKGEYANPGTQLLVTATLGVDADVEYRWWDVNGDGCLSRCEIQKRIKEGGTWPDTWVSLTAPGINVQKLAFYVDGANADDDTQPNVIMLFQGVATAGENIAPFAIQTYVSSRATE